MPTKPADRQSSVAHAPSVFESQLQTLVFEAARLSVVPADPAGVTDHTARTARVHGPWDPQQCALVLLRWLDADLVVLLESATTRHGSQVVSESRQLTYDQARTLLADPGAWSREAAPGTSVSLMYNGVRALEAHDEVWWSAARAGDHHALDGTGPTSSQVSG